MKVAIMQPYFFPYIGYFSLIKNTDRFILLDTVQFIRHGWIDRNRILKQKEGWLYVNVPLLKPDGRSTLIKDVIVNNNENWKGKIRSQLVVYKKNAPYYNDVINLFDHILKIETNDLVELNKYILEEIFEYLGFPKKIEIFSKMNLDIDNVISPDDWALNICKSIGNVKEYWNPIGGIDFFDKFKYRNNNIKLFFQQVNLSTYNQNREIFEQGLSIIDVLMFNSVAEVNYMLDDFQLL